MLGLAVQLAGGGTPVAFALAGAVALLTSYSYAKLSVTFPSRGGTVEFLNQTFGSGLVTGALNVLLWISYVVMLLLYAHAFGSYGASFFAPAWGGWVRHALISAPIVVLAGLNALGSGAVGEAEEWIVGLKLAILLTFVGVGVWTVEPGRLAVSQWSPAVRLAAGGMIIFLAYEGFELIANTARDVRSPRRVLPAAYYASVSFVVVLYVLVSLVTVGNLGIGQITAAKDYALAVAARPFMGHAGFILIAAAAMLSTGSAINATLYGAARVSFIIAKDGDLPEVLEEKVWKRPIVGLLLTALIALAVANLFDLSSISVMGSAGFLLIFAAVNAAGALLHKRTGGKWPVAAAGAVACLAALGALIWQTARDDPLRLLVLAAMAALSLLIEGAYRLASGRQIKPSHPRER